MDQKVVGVISDDSELQYLNGGLKYQLQL